MENNTKSSRATVSRIAAIMLIIATQQAKAVRNVVQVEATANYDEMIEIGSNMTDEMLEELEYVKTDVMRSGYWFLICLEI